MKKIIFFFTLVSNTLAPIILFSQNTVTASFTAPDTVCVNSQVTVQNTSTGASNYYWSFCAADFSTTPEAINLGNPNGLLNTPVFGSYNLDGNGNYYGLMVNYTDGELIRLNFGNSLLNAPVADDLGDFSGVIPAQAEGIQVFYINGNWTAIIVGGGNLLANSSPRIVKIDFGNSLANTPTATNWGNVGGLNLPHDLYIAQEAGNYYGYAINVNDNTITQLSFGPDFTNAPTGTNLGNIGNINYPAGFTFIKYNGNWFAFIANRVTNSLTRLSFGASLQNTPTGTNIGNPGNFLDYPRDISLFTACDGIYGFVVNEQSNEIVKLNFGFDLTSNPTATDLGNLGNLDFPHSISDFFRVGNDIYAFIPNVNSSSLTRIRFIGCQNIPGSSLQNPAAVSYPQPGTYNINLLVDLGLPTQTSFCKQIVVTSGPYAYLTASDICNGDSAVLLFTSTSGTAPFNIGYSGNGNGYALIGLNNNSTFTIPYLLTSTTTFTLTSVTDVNGCSANPDTATTVNVIPLPQGGIAGSTSCSGDSAGITFNATIGTGPFEIEISDGTNTTIYYDIQSGVPFNITPATGITNISLISITDRDGNGCTRTSGFTSRDATITINPSPVVQFDALTAMCIQQSPLLITQAKETTGIAGSGSFSGDGVDAAGNFSPSIAGVGVHKIIYTYTATNGCAASDSSNIVVNPTPAVSAGPDFTTCIGFPVQLNVTGASTYLWSPTTGLDNPNKANPIATVDSTTTYIVLGTDSNGCYASDTITVNVGKNGVAAFVVPNAFTPNGDGHNDCFGVSHWGNVTVVEFNIYNRWGQLVFTSKNPSDCWDGTFKGKPQETGGYPYIIKVKSPCGDLTRTGIVMLVR